ncbi:MAG: periplasmic heavy metal sensor [Bacteroidota bacterium]|nr:periplasmic heavy metal sensor [Bacteroidota bacterium]
MKKIILSLLFVILFAGPLFAQPGDRPRRLMRDHIEKLDLTEQQQETLRALRTATQKEMIDIRAEMKKMRLDLAEMRRSEHPDRTTFETLTRGLADRRVRQAMLRYDAQQKMMQELTAEQQEKFRDMQKDMKRGFREGRGSRRHGGAWQNGAGNNRGDCDGSRRGPRS